MNTKPVVCACGRPRSDTDPAITLRFSGERIFTQVRTQGLDNPASNRQYLRMCPDCRAVYFPGVVAYV